MNVNRIANQSYYENNSGQKTNGKSGGSGFYESLSENINSKNREADENASAAKAAANKTYQYRGVSSVKTMENEMVNMSSISGCDVRWISYQESDYVQVYAKEGYTLAAKVDIDRRSVYIERRMEDGTVSGYEVNPDKINKDSKDPIEQTAAKAWDSYTGDDNQSGVTNKTEETALTFEETLQKFYEFIEDRIKNGPAKIMTGSSEFSVEEWDKFISGIDSQIEDIIEEMRARIEKMDVELQEKLLNGLFMDRDINVVENQVKADGKQYIDAEKIEGLSDSELEKQALSKWRDEMDGVPYGYLAKDGLIEYNGVTFVCDKKHKAIHLGDTSDMTKCIRIPLSKGGCLIVNRNNLDDLATAIGMFSPEDVNLIMRAITEDAKIQQMKQQIDEDESGIKLAEKVEENEDTTEIAEPDKRYIDN